MALIVGLGFYAYKAKNNANVGIETKIDITRDWQQYKDPSGFFVFKHPSSWSLAANMNKCTQGLVMLGATSDAAGDCAVSHDGQILVQAVKGNLLRSTYELIDPYFSENEVRSTSITVDGVAGLKQLGTLVSPSPTYPSLAVGDKILIHIFQKDGYTFVARYYIHTKEPLPDIQSDFERMVLKTLKFK